MNDSHQPIRILDNRYELLEELGAGGMGVVYKARDPVLDITVAVKMLHQVSAQQFLRFQQEAKATARMNHRAMVKVFTFGIADEQPYMVMELLHGRDFKSIIEDTGPMHWQTAIPLFVEICDALAHAHRKGVMHRDLKTTNVMLLNGPEETTSSSSNVSSPQIKILDFGIAKFTTSSSDTPQTQDQTRPGQMIGSPLYMSPEQIAGGKVDNRSDIYSMGCLMFETLTGRTPFIGETLFEILSKHSKDRPPALHEVVPVVPAAFEGAPNFFEFPLALEEVVSKTLAKNPASRFQTMERLANTLLGIDTQIPGLPPPLRETGHLRLAWIAGSMVVALLLALISPFAFRKFWPEQKPIPVRFPIRYESRFTDMVQPLIPVEGKPGVYEVASVKAKHPERGFDSVMVSEIDLVSDTDLKDCKNHKDFIGFYLNSREIEESAFKYMGTQIPSLRIVSLVSSNIDDKGLEWLSKAKDLKHLYIGNCTNVHNYKILRGFRKLLALGLGHNPFEDKDVDNLFEMKDLVHLNLHYTKITDKGLKKLKALPNLTLVTITGCSISEQVIKDLKQSNPKLRIVREKAIRQITGSGP